MSWTPIARPSSVQCRGNELMVVLKVTAQQVDVVSTQRHQCSCTCPSERSRVDQRRVVTCVFGEIVDLAHIEIQQLLGLCQVPLNMSRCLTQKPWQVCCRCVTGTPTRIPVGGSFTALRLFDVGADPHSRPHRSPRARVEPTRRRCVHPHHLCRRDHPLLGVHPPDWCGWEPGRCEGDPPRKRHRPTAPDKFRSEPGCVIGELHTGLQGESLPWTPGKGDLRDYVTRRWPAVTSMGV
jgi:hypothetical protein